MKKIIIEAVLLVLAFFATILLVNSFYNREKNNIAIELNESTIPIAYTEYNGQLINSLHGYISDIDASMLQSGITPLNEDHGVIFWIDEKWNANDQLSYEVRNIDDESLVEDGAVETVVFEDGYVKANIPVRMDLNNQQIYLLILKIKQPDRDEYIKYYARITDLKIDRTPTFLKYATHVSNALLDKDSAKEIKGYLQGSGDKVTNISNVNLHSGFESISYADLHPARLSQPIPTIKDLGEDYAVIEMNCVMTAGDSENTAYYTVSENFQILYTEDSDLLTNQYTLEGDDSNYKEYVLADYERKQEETFHYDGINNLKNYYMIGIADKDGQQYLTSKDSKKLAFIREGQLWYYDYDNTRVSMIYGFWQNDYTSIADTNDQHDLKIMKVDDNGDVTFAVIGYMNRGEHEGHNGIAVYRYHSSNAKMDEVVFFEQKQPYQILNGYASKVLYLNDQDVLYVMLDNAIYKVTTGDEEIQTVVKDVAMEDVVVSDRGNLCAYPVDGENLENATKLMFCDLEAGIKLEIEEEDDTRLKALGFLDDDLVYGSAPAEDLTVNPDGTVFFPMSKVVIMDIFKNVEKEYQEKDVYVMAASSDEKNIYFERSKKTDQGFKTISDDFITYKKENESEVTLAYVDNMYQCVSLCFQYPSNIYISGTPKLNMAKLKVSKQDKVMNIETGDVGDLFYVYTQGTISEISEFLSSAISSAMNGNGYVLDHSGVCVFKTSMIKEYYTVNDSVPRVTSNKDHSAEACIAMIAQYEGMGVDVESISVEDGNVKEALADVLPENTVLDASNTTLDAALFYLSNGAPVITRTSSGKYVLITSFNSEKIRYIDPTDGSDHRADRDGFERNLKDGGSIYISYIH